MAAWVKVAEGNSFDNLRQLVADQELPPGTLIQCEFDTRFPSYFDLPGNEWIFQSKAPPGCKVLDVWGEGPIWPWATGHGYVKMIVEEEAVSGGVSKHVGLFPAIGVVIGWIASHWLAILIATVLITLLISFIRISMKITRTVEETAPWLIWALVIGGVSLAAYLGYKYVTSETKKREVT